jgi:hypothetical protein
MILKISEYKTPHHEKEEREVNNLIHKRPPPSRKRKERRGPKHDNRKNRIKVDDPDLNSSDKDMSLKSKNASDSFWERISIPKEVEEAQERLFNVKNPPRPKKKDITPDNPLPDNSRPEESIPDDKIKENSSSLLDEFNEFVDQIRFRMESENKYVVNAFDNFFSRFCSPHIKENPTEEIIENLHSDLKFQWGRFKKISDVRISGDPSSIIDKYSKLWPNGNMKAWGERCAVIVSLYDSLDSINLPKSFKKFISGDDSDISSIISNPSNIPSTDQLSRGQIFTYSALHSLFISVRGNPPRVNFDLIKDKSKKMSESSYDRALEVSSLSGLLKKLDKSSSFFSRSDNSPREFSPDMSEALRSVENFFSRERAESIFDKDEVMKEIMKSVEKKTGISKKSSFHGYLNQKTTPYRRPNLIEDKFCLDEDDYKNILKVSKELLKSDWLKYGWDNVDSDARHRAALDIAIHVSADGLYQSNIDPSAYNELLNKLAGWDFDTFRETVLDPKKGSSRRSSPMDKKSIISVARVASELLEDSPDVSFRILRNLGSIVMGGDRVALSTGEINDVVSEGVNLKSVESDVKGLMDSKDSDDFLSSLRNVDEFVQKMSSRVSSDLRDLEVIEDLEPAQIESLQKTMKPKFSGLEESVSDGDADSFVDGFQEIVSDVNDFTNQVKQASTRVSLSTLIRIASESPDARKILIPIIAKARLKNKKKPSKTSLKKKDEDKEEKKEKKSGKKKDEEKDEKSSMMKGKKVPPSFKKVFDKKDTKTSKKRKASVDFSPSDASWLYAFYICLDFRNRRFSLCL